MEKERQHSDFLGRIRQESSTKNHRRGAHRMQRTGTDEFPESELLMMPDAGFRCGCRLWLRQSSRDRQRGQSRSTYFETRLSVLEALTSLLSMSRCCGSNTVRKFSCGAGGDDATASAGPTDKQLHRGFQSCFLSFFFCPSLEAIYSAMRRTRMLRLCPDKIHYPISLNPCFCGKPSAAVRPAAPLTASARQVACAICRQSVRRNCSFGTSSELMVNV